LERRPFPDFVRTILEEVRSTLDLVEALEADALAEEILRAGRVYVAGAGRSGLVASCFAMRLVHLGLAAHVVGEATAPGIGPGDLLVVASGSGRTRTVLAQAEAASSRGARVAAVTAHGASPLARAADVVVAIPCAPYVGRGKGAGATAQPGGTLFEQALLLFFDGMFLDLAARTGWSAKALKYRHSNLE
jgi:6-phospho-3-hexuloisomerase